MFTVSDLSSVWVEAPVATRDLGTIRSGMAVQVKASGFEAQATGTITYASALVGSKPAARRRGWSCPIPRGCGAQVCRCVEVTSGEAEVPVAVQWTPSRACVTGTGGLWPIRTATGSTPLELGRSDGRWLRCSAV